MPPNTKSEGTVQVFVAKMPPNTSEGPVQVALPFDQPVYTKVGGSTLEEHSAVYHPGTSTQQEVADNEEDEPVMRITTRARVTYELDRFDKNVLLIITNSLNDPTPLTNVKNSFERYKFEATVIEFDEKNQDNIINMAEKIEQFFQQDFTKIGAAAVAMSTAPKRYHMLSQRGGPIEVVGLLDYFTNIPALQGKPKIFIIETREAAFDDGILLIDGGNADMENAIYAGPPIAPTSTGLPDDLMVIQSKMVNDDKPGRPLGVLSDILTAMPDSSNLNELLPELYRKAQELYPRLRAPVKYYSTLTKELVLSKSEDLNDTDNTVLTEAASGASVST